MKHSLRQNMAVLVSLWSFFSQAAFAADSAESVNAKLKAGKEVAWLIEDSTDKDGDLAVLFTSRTKGSKPADFPMIVEGVEDVDTDALNEDTQIMENIVVSLKEKRVIGRIQLSDSEDVVYFPHKNHGSLSVLWGPEEEGWHFGLLVYGAKWDSREVMLIESDGERLRQTSIIAMLNAKATATIAAAIKGKKGIVANYYGITYGPLAVVDADAGYSVGNPVTVKIDFSAEVPKSDEAPYIDGYTMTVLLETSRDKISAKALKVTKAKE